MLPAHSRLRRSEDFRLVLRNGVRAGRRRLVVHALAGERDAEVPRTGFVVSKAVGNSVVRHRVIRQLRHLVADYLGTLPAGHSLVVRALPPAASASSRELGSDLNKALRRLGLVPEHKLVSDAASSAVGNGTSDSDGPTV